MRIDDDDTVYGYEHLGGVIRWTDLYTDGAINNIIRSE